MSAAVRAFASGLRAVVGAPGLLLVVLFATLLTVAPFGVVLGREIQSALAHQPPIDLAAQEIDAEWWLEYRRHATGLAATFTPAILGFAAPLENISALLDGVVRPSVLALPVVLYAAVWAFLWGVLLQRFHAGQRLHLSGAYSAGARHFVPFVTISILAGVIVLALYATIHAWLFGPLFDAIAARAGSEPAAFAGRVVLYLTFGALLAAVSLAADYTRIAMIVHDTRSVRDGFANAAGLMRSHPTAVALLFVLSAGTFVAALGAYGVADLRFRGWRAVLLAQAFIVGRLALRLVTAASQLDLYKRLRAV
jgi:hypothetical protein